MCVELVLKHNEITSVGAAILANALRTNTTLQKLNLGYNRLGDNGVQSLAASLIKDNTTLTKLHLQSNGISRQGAAHLATMLRSNRTLLHLALDENNIGDSGVKLLSDGLGSDGNLANERSNSQVSIDESHVTHLIENIEVINEVVYLFLV